MSNRFKDLYIFQQKLHQEQMERDAKILKEQQEIKDEFIKRKEQREQSERNNIDHYVDFVNAVPTRFLEITLSYILKKSIKDNIHDKDLIIENTIAQYIQENGTCNIMSRCNRLNTLALSEIHRLVTEKTEEILNKVDDEDFSTQVIHPDDIEDFYNSLDDEDEFDNVATAIAMRVANAEEEFINNNIDDKRRSEEIISNVQKRIEAIKQDIDMDNEEKEKYEEEYSNESHIELNEIIYGRDRNIFEQMTINLYDGIMHNTVLKEIYELNGKLDTDRIMDTSKIMYTMLEMCNTLQLEDINEEYISNILANIRK